MARMIVDSGVKWLGLLPKDWSLDRIGSCFTLRSEKVSDADFPPLSVTKQGVLPQLEHVAKSDDHSNRKLVRAGDFAINSRSDRRNSCGFADRDGSVSLINTVCVPLREMDPRYFGHLFNTSQFADEFYAYGHGIVADLWTTGWKDMKNILLPIPPLDEQSGIASYLDAKCAEIDRAIEAAERSIEEYEWLRKSYVTSMVKHRSGWSKTRLSHVCSRIFDGPFGSNLKSVDYVDSGVFVVRLENLRYLWFNLEKQSFVTQSKYESISAHTVFPGDLLMSTFIVDSIKVCEMPSAFSFAVNKADCIGIRPKDPSCTSWIKYCLASMDTFDYLSGLIHGTTRPRVNTTQIRTIPIPMPDKDTRDLIVDSLDQMNKAIDEVIANKRSIIDDLRAYKQSLIYEVVTGKREV